MSCCLIVFDLDTACLKRHYHGQNCHNAYADIQRVFLTHHFTNLQGTVYLSNPNAREAHGTLALQEAAASLPWFASCVGNVHIYEIAASFNAQFIIDGAQKARVAFEAKITQIREKMISSGVDAELINQFFDTDQFMHEK